MGYAHLVNARQHQHGRNAGGGAELEYPLERVQIGGAHRVIDRVERPVVESIPENVEQIAERETGLGYAPGLPLGIAFDLARVEQRARRGDQIHRLHTQRLQYRGRFR